MGVSAVGLSMLTFCRSGQWSRPKGRRLQSGLAIGVTVNRQNSLFEHTFILLTDGIESGIGLLGTLFGQAADAVPADAGADGAADPEMTPIQRILFGPFVLPLGLFFLFYLTFIAPERRRKAEEAKLMSSLKKNDRVITIGGIHGTVVSISPESKVVTLKIDEGGNTRIKVNRSAIASVDKSTDGDKDSKDG